MKKWILALSVASTAVNAAPITYEFTGTVTERADSGGPAPGFFPWFPEVGEIFTGRFAWDRTTVVPAVAPEDYYDSNPTQTPCVGPQYCGGADDLSVAFTHITLREMVPEALLATYAADNHLLVEFWFLNRAYSANAPAVLAEYMWVDFEFAHALSDLASLDMLPSDAFIGGSLHFQDGEDYDSLIASIDSFGIAQEVPAPGTIALMGAGLAGLWVTRRRR